MPDRAAVVLIDTPAFATELRHALVGQPVEIAATDDPATGLLLVGRTCPDVVLLGPVQGRITAPLATAAESIRGPPRSAREAPVTLPDCFEGRQNRRVSKNELPVAEVCRPTPLTGPALSAGDAVTLAAGFKAVADPTRLRLLSLIAAHAGGEACVCDLTGDFDLSGPTISHHLKVLREAGLITGERRGTWIYYRVVPDALAALSQALSPAAHELEVTP